MSETSDLKIIHNSVGAENIRPDPKLGWKSSAPTKTFATLSLMQLKRLQAQDFRNYPSQNWEFAANQVVFCGANGRGKTNVLEAISLLSVGKSWRETAATDLIYTGAAPDSLSARINGHTDNNDKLEALIEPRKRTFYKNEKIMPRTRFFGQLPTLLFCPEFIHLFGGPKAARVQFFDRFLIQISPKYREHLLKATRAHKQKTRILRQVELFGPNTAEQLAPWNHILAGSMPVLWDEKVKLIQQLNPVLQSELNEISQTHEPITIELAQAEKIDYTPEALPRWFSANENREVAAQKNFIAPGRDDWNFKFRDQNLSATASRGEERSVLLALLAAQKALLTQELQTPPVLLLDDVFSELDDTRQRHLEHLCAGSQVFFSTTHKEHFDGFSGEIQVFEL